MDNNILKENCLEVINENKMVTVNNSNMLPALAIDSKMLLPVIIPREDQSLVFVQQEIEKIKNRKFIKILLKKLRTVCVLCAKLIRYMFLFITGIICFLGVGLVVIMTTAIITRNIVNSKCEVVDPDPETSFSIFVPKGIE